MMTLKETITNTIDVDSKVFSELFPVAYKTLLKDQTTGRNIIWATKDYGFSETDEIVPDIVKPRCTKLEKQRKQRTKNRAEVFTPLWICNKQNNLIDREWFGKDGVFNKETGKTWVINQEPIPFLHKHPKGWIDYVQSVRMEICCGEAPYLTSRYNSSPDKGQSPNLIPVSDRIGLFDRKLRVISENAPPTPSGFLRATLDACRSIYGFELQGDNLFLARKNIFFTVLDYFFVKYPNIETIDQFGDLIDLIAEAISWNIWQMDFTTQAVPFLPDSPCKIRDWQKPQTYDDDMLGLGYDEVYFKDIHNKSLRQPTEHPRNRTEMPLKRVPRI